MLGLEEAISSLWLQLLLSVALAVLGFSAVALVRRIRHQLVEEYRPIVVDLISSILVVWILVTVTLVVADIWGMTETLFDQFGVLRLDERAPEVVLTLVVLVSIQVFNGVTARLLSDLATESRGLTQHQREVALRITQITLWSLGGIVVLGVWNVDLTGLLVGAGFLGIVVGMAARTTLGSLLGGLVLMFSQPFEVGDWVLIEEREGVVSDITLMSTRIQGFDGEYIVVPNDVVTNKTIINKSRQGRLRVGVDVGIDYDADVDRARDTVRDAAETVATDHDFVRSSDIEVIAQRFDDSAVVLAVRVWINDPTIHRAVTVRDKLVGTVKRACEDDDIDIPFPQRELSGRAGFRIGDSENAEE